MGGFCQASRIMDTTGAGREVADGWDEALGGGATGQAGADDARGVGQGDAAGGAAGVDEEDFHAGDFLGIQTLCLSPKVLRLKGLSLD